jgi:RNA polymerase sigma-70 factor (ECF subfamily)
MPEDSTFRDLIRRIRAGEEEAAAELVRRYEPTIRRAVRVRLRDPRLGRVFDSLDIYQSVMASFFVRAALGQYDLESPDQVLKLLGSMARNKLANAANKQRADCRDVGRQAAGNVNEFDLAARESSPSSQVAARELLQEARRRLASDERRLLELREEGREWEAIAEELGGNPEALRKKLARAVARVSAELGLDEPGQK